MTFYTPRPEGGFMHSGAETLDRQLREGDGIHWKGDPRLWLGIGVLTEKATGRTARRYEVWRHCEDGVDRMIDSWNPAEFDRILFDIARMRAGHEGREVSVLDRIDAHNEAKERKVLDQYRDNMGAAMEHGAKLLHDTTEGPNTFRQVGGLRDEPKADADAGQ